MAGEKKPVTVETKPVEPDSGLYLSIEGFAGIIGAAVLIMACVGMIGDIVSGHPGRLLAQSRNALLIVLLMALVGVAGWNLRVHERVRHMRPVSGSLRKWDSVARVGTMVAVCLAAVAALLDLVGGWWKPGCLWALPVAALSGVGLAVGVWACGMSGNVLDALDLKDGVGEDNHE